MAALNNSNVVVVWASFNQAGSNSLLDVYAKILSPTGATVKDEFLVNQFTNYNQRTPAVAALKDGGFVVTGFPNSNSRRCRCWEPIQLHYRSKLRSLPPAWTFMRGFSKATAWRRAMNFW